MDKAKVGESSYRFVILGPPIPLKRARKGVRGFYDSQKELKQQAILSLIVDYGTFVPIKEPIRVLMKFFMPIPDSLSKPKKAALDGQDHIKKPDLTNLAKFYEDAFNEVLWADDALIYEMRLQKSYDTTPRTEILIELDG